MKTTYHANKNLVLVDNEVYFLGKSASTIKGDLVYDTIEKRILIAMEDYETYHKLITATTNKNIPNVHHLERKLFVKPDVDLDGLAFEYSKQVKGAQGKAYSRLDFKAGFNANKKEFTLEQFQRGVRMAFITGSTEGKMNINQIIDSVQPLSLPSSIESNEDFTEINVNW